MPSDEIVTRVTSEYDQNAGVIHHKTEKVNGAIFYNKNGVENLSLSLLDGLPYTMKSAGKEIMIFAGKTDKLYWIEENGNAEYEDALKPHLAKIIEQGSIEIFKITGKRISAIRIGDLFFCKLIPESFIEEE